MGNISGAADAFSIGGFTLDPQLAAGGEGFDRVVPLATVAAAAGDRRLGRSVIRPTAATSLPKASMSTAAADQVPPTIGTITTGEDVTNLLGFTNTQLIVTGATGSDGGIASDLPTVGSVYDAFNLGNGYENVYTATPGTAGGDATPSPTPW